MPHEVSARRFAALGDPLRLELLGQIAERGEASISELAGMASVTRQAVTKHLTVLESAELISGARQGREHRWRLCESGLAALNADTERMAALWRRRLTRLKLLVENEQDQSHQPE